MINPVLVEVTRGGRVESRHRGAIAVVDAEGRAAFQQGDIDQPVYPRSAVKALQALPLIESGAADRYGLTHAEIALACSSHNAEPEHVAASASMLTKAGRDVSALECGAHWPLRDRALRAMLAGGQSPSALHNNCSGKHAGFVCLACQEGHDPAGYIQGGHPVMREVTAAVADACGQPLADEPGTDGCSIPTHAIPLRALAHAYARFGTGHGFGPERAKAAARIRAAVAAEPFFVAGTDRFDTVIMRALGHRAFTKTGAEGVFCAAWPELGLGVALKCDDGGTRAAEVMMAAITALMLPMDTAQEKAVAALARPQLTNWNGIAVGEIRPVSPLL
jgi:L-asparaginase II